MHYIYSQSIVVGALIKSWESYMLEPHTSPLCCSDLLLTARQACTAKGIPLPTFTLDFNGELDEIILCTAEIVVANLNHVKLNTCSPVINDINKQIIDLDKQGLEIIYDGLRLLRRDMEGMRSHFLPKMWLEQNKLNEAYEHVDIMLSFIDQALHGCADAFSYHSLLERYKSAHSQDHFGEAHINFYAVDSSVAEDAIVPVSKELPKNVVGTIFDDGQQASVLHNESVFAYSDLNRPNKLNDVAEGSSGFSLPKIYQGTQETNSPKYLFDDNYGGASLELTSNTGLNYQSPRSIASLNQSSSLNADALSKLKASYDQSLALSDSYGDLTKVNSQAHLQGIDSKDSSNDLAKSQSPAVSLNTTTNESPEPSLANSMAVGHEKALSSEYEDNLPKGQGDTLPNGYANALAEGHGDKLPVGQGEALAKGYGLSEGLETSKTANSGEILGQSGGFEADSSYKSGQGAGAYLNASLEQAHILSSIDLDKGYIESNSNPNIKANASFGVGVSLADRGCTLAQDEQAYDTSGLKLIVQGERKQDSDEELIANSALDAIKSSDKEHLAKDSKSEDNLSLGDDKHIAPESVNELALSLPKSNSTQDSKNDKPLLSNQDSLVSYQQGHDSIVSEQSGHNVSEADHLALNEPVGERLGHDELGQIEQAKSALASTAEAQLSTSSEKSLGGVPNEGSLSSADCVAGKSDDGSMACVSAKSCVSSGPDEVNGAGAYKYEDSDLGSLEGKPLYGSESEQTQNDDIDSSEAMGLRIRAKQEQEYIAYENIFSDSEVQAQASNDIAPNLGSVATNKEPLFSKLRKKHGCRKIGAYEPHVEVKPKKRFTQGWFGKLISLDGMKYVINTTPNTKIRWGLGLSLTFAIIVALFLSVWGGIYTMSYLKLSTLGTLTQAKIVAIEDEYIHKKESRYLDRVEHHFLEIVEFKLKDGKDLRTPLYLYGRRDSTQVRQVGTSIMVLYKNDDPTSLIDANSIMPFFNSIFITIFGVVILVVGAFLLIILNLRFYRHDNKNALKSSLVSVALIGSSVFVISDHFEQSLHWLYNSASEDEVLFDNTNHLLLSKDNKEPYTGLVRSFKNGIYIISNYENGLKDGTEYIYVAAQPVGYFNYSNGKLDGDYQAIDDYGRLESRGTYRAGYLDGSWTKYEAVRGQVAATGQWLWGAKDGTWTFYRVDGSKYCVENYSQDMLDGRYYEYSPLGKLILKTYYVKDVAHGKITRYWPNGTKLYQAQLEHGIVNGPFNAYYADGIIFVSGVMKYGRWYKPPKVFNHLGVELDSAQKRLYRKSKDKQISTIKRAIALDYNLTFDEVGLANSMYKFRVGSGVFSFIDYDFASEYAQLQGSQDFNYFKVPSQNKEELEDIPVQRNYIAIRAKGFEPIPTPKELEQNNFFVDIEPAGISDSKENQDIKVSEDEILDGNENYQSDKPFVIEADPFSTDQGDILGESDFPALEVTPWHSNSPIHDSNEQYNQLEASIHKKQLIKEDAILQNCPNVSLVPQLALKIGNDMLNLDSTMPFANSSSKGPIEPLESDDSQDLAMALDSAKASIPSSSRD